jgi:hypothetical protein
LQQAKNSLSFVFFNKEVQTEIDDILSELEKTDSEIALLSTFNSEILSLPSIQDFLKMYLTDIDQRADRSEVMKVANLLKLILKAKIL